MRKSKDKNVISVVVRAIPTGLAIALLSSAFCGCGAQMTPQNSPGDDEQIETGGVADHSDPKAPKSIESRDLESFHLRMEVDFTVTIPAKEGEESATVYPTGMYDLSMERVGGDVAVKIDFPDASYEFMTDDSAIISLEELLREHNVASMNGHSQRNSALGTYIDLEAKYASGERISIYAEGGASVIPNGWSEDYFIAFFDGILTKETGKSYASNLVEDNSDPDAVKEFTSDVIGEIYVEFDPDAGSYGTSEFEYGDYRFQYMKGRNLPYEGVETNAALWIDYDKACEFDCDEEDLNTFNAWIRDCGFQAQNGWNKSTTLPSDMRLELHVSYENGEFLTIEGDGKDALPAAWDPEAFLNMLQDMAERHGVPFGALKEQ